MINDDLERWRQAVAWIEECEMRLHTIMEGEDDDGIWLYLEGALWGMSDAANTYRSKIKSRETLKAQLQDSLSQATDGGSDGKEED